MGEKIIFLNSLNKSEVRPGPRRQRLCSCGTVSKRLLTRHAGSVLRPMNGSVRFSSTMRGSFEIDCKKNLETPIKARAKAPGFQSLCKEVFGRDPVETMPSNVASLSAPDHKERRLSATQDPGLAAGGQGWSPLQHCWEGPGLGGRGNKGTYTEHPLLTVLLRFPVVSRQSKCSQLSGHCVPARVRSL